MIDTQDALPAPYPLSDQEGLHIALGGGSARGLAHMGMLLALQDHHIPIASIAGSSMGSLVGASFALLGHANEVINHFLEHVKSEQFNQTRYAFLKAVTRRNREDRGFKFSRGLRKGYLLGQSYTKGSIVTFEEFSAEINALIPNKTFKTTQIPFLATGVDLMATKEVVFHAGYLRSAVMASSSIPGLFPPICSGDVIYIDGGWMNKVPVTPLLGFGAEKVLAIDVSEVHLPPLNPKRGTHLMRMADTASQIRLQQLQMKRATHVWQPPLEGLDLMDFDQVERAVDLGYSFAKEHLDEAKRLCDAPAPTTQSWRERLAHYLAPQPTTKHSHPIDFEVRGIWDISPLENS